MRAFAVKEHVHPSKITLSTDFPEPEPSGRDVIVDVYSAGLNYFDLLQSQGKYQIQPPLPFVLGTEFSGRISQTSPIPKGCPFKHGDRIFGYSQGAYAERMKCDWKELQHLPRKLSYDDGAGLMITWPTSYEALVGRAELKAGEWVLITAAAGGVGLTAVQLAKALGATVIAAASTDAKLDICKRLGGADYTVDYTKPDWQKQVNAITKGKGVNVIFDPVGMIRDCLKCIAFKGRAIVVGFAGGPIEKLPMNLVLLKNIAITGIYWGSYTKNDPERIPVVWKELLKLLSSGKVKPVNYAETYTLENLASGLQALENRKTYGKAIVRVQLDDSDSGNGSSSRAKL